MSVASRPMPQINFRELKQGQEAISCDGKKSAEGLHAGESHYLSLLELIEAPFCANVSMSVASRPMPQINFRELKQGQEAI